MSSDAPTVTLTRQAGYRFMIDFGEAIPQLLADEPAPLGEGDGPAPSHLLLASVANCLSASLLFALKKFRQDPGPLKATATADMGRDESQRLRIRGIQVQLELGRPAPEMEHLDRVLAQFEAFCTVSMSVRQGIAIGVQVQDSTGVVLKA